MSITRINIDPERCAGHARCVAQAPEVYGYDDVTNQSHVLAGADLSANEEAIRLTVEACPERAITLSENDV